MSSVPPRSILYADLPGASPARNVVGPEARRLRASLALDQLQVRAIVTLVVAAAIVAVAAAVAVALAVIVAAAAALAMAVIVAAAALALAMAVLAAATTAAATVVLREGPVRTLGEHLLDALLGVLRAFVLVGDLGLRREDVPHLRANGDAHEVIECVVGTCVLDDLLRHGRRNLEHAGQLGLVGDDGILVCEGVKRGLLGGEFDRLVGEHGLEFLRAHAHAGEDGLEGQALLLGVLLVALDEAVRCRLDELGGDALLEALGKLGGAERCLGELRVRLVHVLLLGADRIAQGGKGLDALEVLGDPLVRRDVLALVAARAQRAFELGLDLALADVGDGDGDLDGVVRGEREVIVALDE